MVIVDFKQTIVKDVVGSQYNPMSNDEEIVNTLKFNPVLEMALSGGVPVTSSTTLTNSTIVFTIKPNKLLEITEITHFTFSDIFSKLGGHLASLTGIFFMFSSVLVLRWFMEFADAIKDKFRLQYENELKHMVAKYQNFNKDWKPITEDMTVEELEERFDMESSKYLGVNNIGIEDQKPEDNSIFLDKSNINLVGKDSDEKIEDSKL